MANEKLTETDVQLIRYLKWKLGWRTTDIKRVLFDSQYRQISLSAIQNVVAYNTYNDVLTPVYIDKTLLPVKPKSDNRKAATTSYYRPKQRKLSAIQVKAIRKAYELDWIVQEVKRPSYQKLARQYNVSPATIQKICTYQFYKDVT
jgi:hypothetical protein